MRKLPIFKFPIFVFVFLIIVSFFNVSDVFASNDSWYMAGANPERTSWVSSEATGNLRVEWYKPIEAFIDKKTQVITANGKLYIATSRGLYAMNAATGEVVWKYNTDFPLGSNPTVIDTTIYIGGYDGAMRALNAQTGEVLWVSARVDGAFEANPIVVNGKIYEGNRNGYFYAFNTSDGSLAWQYPAASESALKGSISQSPAYDSTTNTLFFAANDMYGYALNANDGSLNWRTENKLQGHDFRNFWPVVYKDWVVFVSNMPYRDNWQLPYNSLLYPNGSNTGFAGGYIGPTFLTGSAQDTTGINWPWPTGTKVVDLTNLLTRLQNNPHLLTHAFFRKTDGQPMSTPAPFIFTGNNGNGDMYPPIVMPDGAMYQTTNYRIQPATGLPVEVVGWLPGTPYVKLTTMGSVIDEPIEFSGGGNRLYRRRYFVEGASRNIMVATNQTPAFYWNNTVSLVSEAPEYREMYRISPCQHAVGFCKWYQGTRDSVNGIYDNGRENPLIPYQGKVYMIDYNSVLAFSPAGGGVKLPELPIEAPSTTTSGNLTQEEIQSKLNNEIQKILAVYTPGSSTRFLKPGYYDDGQNMLRQHDDYFRNPGDTLFTLSYAYPQLPENLKAGLKTYLDDYFQTYFGGSNMYTHIGWVDGSARDSLVLPPDIQAQLAAIPAATRPPKGWSWMYPQTNIYDMWYYVKNVNPSMLSVAYAKAKSKIEIKSLSTAMPGPQPRELSNWFLEFPFEEQGYMAGYIGFLKLYELSGSPTADANLASQVQAALDTFSNHRYQTFSKDSFWAVSGNGNHLNRRFNIARNFMWLKPDVAEKLSQNIKPQIEEALNEYQYVAPFWFVNAYQTSYMETASQQLFDSPALFQAKAWILKQDKNELSKYLDKPTFERGDLFYIQNLVATIEAQ